RTERFHRFSALLLQGTVWLTLPVASFLAVEASAAVKLLYGTRWDGVIPLLPLACAFLALRGVNTTLNTTMLANLQASACLKVDLVAAVFGILAMPLAMPYGVIPYLFALVVCELGTFAANAYLATRGRAITAPLLLNLLVPCLLATAIATLLVVVLQ